MYRHRGPTGHHLDLGYDWKADGIGEWVGYYDEGRSTRSYVILRADKFAAILAQTGFHNLPPIPQRPTDSPLWWLVLPVAFLAVRHARRAIKLV
jgi:hypothetical protein